MTKIPLNKEHAEAYQAECDSKRENTKKILSPDDLRRLEAIEKASAMLKEAGVEFYLHCINARLDRDDGGSKDWFFFWFKNEDESKYFEDGEKFGARFVSVAIGEGEKFLRRGLSAHIHGGNGSGPFCAGPLCMHILRDREAKGGLTPPPEVL